MDMSNIATFFVNNGTAVACVIYFMYMQATTMKDFTTAINTNTQAVNELKDKYTCSGSTDKTA